MSEPDNDARSLFGLRKRAPKRPLIVTIILFFGIGLFLLSGPRELERDSALRQARAFVEVNLPSDCGPISGIRESRVDAVKTDSGSLERFEVQLSVRLASGHTVGTALEVWPGIRIGPRVPLPGGDHLALFEFSDGVEFMGAKLAC